MTECEFQVLQDQEELLELRALLALQVLRDILEYPDHVEFRDRKVDADYQEEEEVFEVLEVLKAW